MLRLCQKAGLVSLGMVALDGTKIRANASKHKAMSHECMLKSERQLESEMRALLRKAEPIEPRRTVTTARTSRAARCPRSCSDVPAGLEGFTRPLLN